MKWIHLKGRLYCLIAQRYVRREYNTPGGRIWQGWFRHYPTGHIIKVEYLLSTSAYWIPGHSKQIIQNQPHPARWVRWIVPEKYLLP